jgi:ABC-type multidrug transport system fused ATPase/permease subunit
MRNVSLFAFDAYSTSANVIVQPLDEIDGSPVTGFVPRSPTSTATMSSNTDLRALTPSATTGTSSGSVDTYNNRDYPLPSVEQHVYDHNTSSTASTAKYTPSPSSSTKSNQQTDGQDADVRDIEDFRNLRLTSPLMSNSPLQRGSRTPSIHVTTSVNSSNEKRAGTDRDDSVVAGVAALNIEPLRVDSLGAHEAPNARSPSPSRRRRSGSGIRKERHDIESELPPDHFAHMSEAQNALARSKILTTKLATILSQSTFSLESGSHIKTLHRQAAELSNFQLPSSRIVGLVGDSGVGKSSLINSLLDKIDLARAVS